MQGRSVHQLEQEGPQLATTMDGNEVILVTGGSYSPKTVEIINTFDGSVTMLPNQLVLRRFGHGIGILRIENQDKIVVFGGTNGTFTDKTLESVGDKFPKNGYLDLCSQNDDSKTNRFCDFSRQNIAIISNR